MGWSPAPHWATISCVALSTPGPTAASDPIKFVWDSSKGKSTGSDHCRAYKRYYNVICVLLLMIVLNFIILVYDNYAHAGSVHAADIIIIDT